MRAKNCSDAFNDADAGSGQRAENRFPRSAGSTSRLQSAALVHVPMLPGGHYMKTRFARRRVALAVEFDARGVRARRVIAAVDEGASARIVISAGPAELSDTNRPCRHKRQDMP
jgi:hypothetical protein